jgi:hypothetical protein
MNTSTQAAPVISSPKILLQINNSGSWKTLSTIGLNDMARCRDAVDTLCLADCSAGRKAMFRMAIHRDDGRPPEPLDYRDPVRGWYQA